MILKKYTILDKTVLLRYPKPIDAQGLRNVINSLFKENADIAKTTQVTIQQEKAWLNQTIKSIKNKEKIMILAELDGTIVGSCEITRDPYDVSKHVGTLGIRLIKKARGNGIGTNLIKLTLEEAKKKLKLKLVKLYVFDSNNIGKSLYEEMGFSEIGRIPRGVYHNKKYKDDIIMAKTL
ncbi:MAG: N-acetyltransferase family protein [Candidatus Nitrosotenuis sp.]